MSNCLIIIKGKLVRREEERSGNCVGDGRQEEGERRERGERKEREGEGDS